MRVPRYPWDLRALLEHRPSVGWLMDLCEENYQYLLRLAPELRHLRGSFLSQVEEGVDLYLEVQEQTPYTTQLHLTYYFDHSGGQLPNPDIQLRVYHDSAQAEVLDLRRGGLQLEWDPDNPRLEQKWKANLFLNKWLVYCMRQGHRFDTGQSHSFEKAPVNGIC